MTEGPREYDQTVRRMARNPVDEADIETLREQMHEQREEIREALAEDLGGSPDDYDAVAFLRERADEPVTDGGTE